MAAFLLTLAVLLADLAIAVHGLQAQQAKQTAQEIVFFPQTALELNGVLNSSKKQVLFHHHFRVLARVPGLVSLLFWHPVPSSFPGSC